MVYQKKEFFCNINLVKPIAEKYHAEKVNIEYQKANIERKK